MEKLSRRGGKVSSAIDVGMGMDEIKAENVQEVDWNFRGERVGSNWTWDQTGHPV